MSLNPGICEVLTGYALMEASTGYALYDNGHQANTSSIYIKDGYLHMHFVSDPVRSTSNFNFYDTGFEVSAELRQAFDPLHFSISNADTTADIEYLNGDYTCSLYTGGDTYSNWGSLDLTVPVEEQFFTDYICVSSEDIENKYVALTYLFKDVTNVSLNVVGGVPQELGIDFYIDDNLVKWDGLELDGEINPGDILRVQYIPQGLSDPGRFKIVLEGTALTFYGLENGHYKKLAKRALHSSPAGAWTVSFYMDRHLGPNMSRGYVSKFLVIADSFSGTDKALPYQHKTWRQPIIFTDRT